MHFKPLLAAMAMATICACSKSDKDPGKHEDPSSFQEIASIDIGSQGAAEITAFDPKTNRLFVVNNGGTNQIDVLDMANPAGVSQLTVISLSSKYNGAVNSLAVHDGLLAAAVESSNKQQPGKVVVFNTTTYAEVKVIEVGALPDMVTFSPDGQSILTANEGEPIADYLTDPVGSVSIISVKNGYSVTNVNFDKFTGSVDALKAKGLRVFGPNASFAQDMEPEYVTVSNDSRTAWVTLQENNAIARIDLNSKTATHLFPLGFKDYSKAGNGIDPSDKDNVVSFRNVPVFGIYQPDAICVLQKGNTPYLFTVNEGDVREYTTFIENKRVGSITLDPAVFTDATLKNQENLGRLNITTTLGDANKDGKYEALYSFGARSFSVWDGNSGSLLYDNGNQLEQAIQAQGYYEDGRSDDKGIEPEGLDLGEMGGKNIAFVGLERVDAVAIYDVSNPTAPSLLKILKTGDAPEGILFIPAKESPIKKSLLVVSSEDDGVIKVYAPTR